MPKSQFAEETYKASFDWDTDEQTRQELEKAGIKIVTKEYTKWHIRLEFHHPEFRHLAWIPVNDPKNAYAGYQEWIDYVVSTTYPTPQYRQWSIEHYGEDHTFNLAYAFRWALQMAGYKFEA